MRVLVIGLGSMGKRRIRLLKQLDDRIEIGGVDAREDRRKEAEELYHLSVYDSIEAALKESRAEGAFISTSPASHGKIIRECLERNLHVFTELNLIPDLYQENIELAEKKERILFLSSTFLYRKEIQYIAEQVGRYGRSLNYTYHVGQYLPEWHPWENYNSFFAGDKRTNGCREILAIELPWITSVFGPIRKAVSLHNKNSDLQIAYDDNYIIQIEHENGCKGSLAVDVICPKAVRNLEVFGEHFYLTWDGTPDGLKQFQSERMEEIRLYDTYEHRAGYQATIVENAYMDEIKAFLLEIKTGQKPVYDFRKDRIVLEWIDRIEDVK